MVSGWSGRDCQAADTGGIAAILRREGHRRPKNLGPSGERQTALALLREPRFVDLAPAEVYATLLDEGLYHCPIRTMRRLRAKHDEVWSRDITKLMAPAKRSYYSLHVILDIFSRRVNLSKYPRNGDHLRNCILDKMESAGHYQIAEYRSAELF